MELSGPGLMAALKRFVIFLHLGWTSTLALGENFPRRPNIVFVLADDLGWNEVPWHNSELGYDEFLFVHGI